MKRVSILLLLLAVAAHAQKRPTKPSTPPAEPERFVTVQWRNPDFVVRRLDIPAGESASFGANVHDYLLIGLAPGTLSLSGYQTDVELPVANDELQVLLGGWPHKLTNHSTETAHLLAVETTSDILPKSAICGLGSKGCHDVRTGSSAEGEYEQTLLFETDAARVFRVNLGGHVSMHQHRDPQKHLIIALTAFHGSIDDKSFHLQRGETLFTPTGFDDLLNEGSDSARFYIVEVRQH